MADKSATALAEAEHIDGPRRFPLKSPRVRVALFLGGIVLLAGGFVWYFDHQNRGRYMQRTDNAYVAADSVVVAPRIAGYVERVLVTENQAVRQGQLLAKLDPREYRARSEQIASEIETATAVFRRRAPRSRSSRQRSRRRGRNWTRHRLKSPSPRSRSSATNRSQRPAPSRASGSPSFKRRPDRRKSRPVLRRPDCWPRNGVSTRS